MLTTFCLRLACGMSGSLLLLSPSQVNQRFYRVQFLIVLALTAAATVSLPASVGVWLWLVLALAMPCAFLGSISWSLEGTPGGRSLVVLTALTSSASLVASTIETPHALPAEMSETVRSASLPWLLADELSSAALLGSATTAMLMGHSYLIAPAMSLMPLLRLLAALFASTFFRLLIAAFGLWSWTRVHSLDNLEDEVFWLPVRWGVGFLFPLFLSWMAWQTAKIRSTQSATGILYVVVIFCFLGELTSQLLLRKTGFIL